MERRAEEAQAGCKTSVDRPADRFKYMTGERYSLHKPPRGRPRRRPPAVHALISRRDHLRRTATDRPPEQPAPSSPPAWPDGCDADGGRRGR